MNDIELDIGLQTRIRQLLAIIRIEIRKSLFLKRAFISYGLAIVPILLMLSMANNFDVNGVSIDYARRIFSYIYSGFILGAVVFFGSAAIFTSLFRGEILNCSMHYYLLSPIRREILVLGKYLAGLMSAWMLFGSTTIICYLLLYLPFDLSRLMVDMGNGVGMDQMLAYFSISLLGCLGYGSLFMATGLIFRNPLIPVVVIAGLELIHFVLPPALKIFSVIHYLKGMLPIPMNDGPFAITVMAPSITASVIGILGLTLFSLVITLFYLNRFEIKYTED